MSQTEYWSEESIKARQDAQEAKRLEVRAGIAKATEEVKNGQFLSLRAVAYALGLSQQQVVRAMEEGKLKTREQHVVTPQRLEEFALNHLTNDKNGKKRVK